MLHREPRTIDCLLMAQRQNKNVSVKYSQDKGVEVSYYKTICDNGKEGVEVKPVTESFELSHKTLSHIFEVDQSDIRVINGKIVLSNPLLQILNSVIPPFIKKFNIDVLKELSAKSGLHPNGSKRNMLPSVFYDETLLNPIGIWQIEKEYADSGLDSPFVIGEDNIYKANKALANDNLFYEPEIQHVYDNPECENVITFDPNVLRLITFSETLKCLTDKECEIPEIDCFDPTEFNHAIRVYENLIADIKFKYCPDTYKWRFQFSLMWGLFHIDACNGSNVNGIMHFTMCKPAIVSCSDNNS